MLLLSAWNQNRGLGATPEEYVRTPSAKSETSERCFYKPTVGNFEHMLSMTAVIRAQQASKREKHGITKVLTEGTDKKWETQGDKGRRRAEGQKWQICKSKRFIKRMGLHNNLSAWVGEKIDRNSKEWTLKPNNQ